jgi:hypothetical protein
MKLETPSATPPSAALVALLTLEREVRRAASLEALRFILVNRSRSLLPAAQIALLDWPASGMPRVLAAADVPDVERNAPFIRWLETVAAERLRQPDAAKTQTLNASQTTPELAADWAEFSAAQALWLPLPLPEATAAAQPIAVLWLARQQPWSPEEMVLAERLAETYGHAWALLAQRKGRIARRRGWPAFAKLQWLVLALIIAAGFIPVRQSALAPAEIVPRDPFLVTAPLDGVVARLHVRPNEAVRAGQPLLDLEDTDLRARAEVAAQELAVAQAELRSAQQGAFGDPRSGAQIALLTAQANLRATEHQFAQARLERSKVKAERDGVAVFRSANDWLGRPVSTGMRILTIADPARVEIEARLPVADAVALESGAAVQMFLDSDPLKALDATLRDAAFEPEVGADNIAAYRVNADLALPAGAALPRLGLRGTAKIQGRPVPLALYLFRRPAAALRQMIGF